MLDFILAALPFAAAGVSVAVVAVHFSRRKKKEKKKDDYSLEGMCLGTSFGVILGAMGVLDQGTCLSLGILIGLAIGMCVPKQEKGRDKGNCGGDTGVPQ